MFERFTERSRKAVVLAHDEARHFNHNYIGTEHFLLGLLREEEGVAAQALTSLGVTVEKVREQVESIVGYGEKSTGTQTHFTPSSKKVLERALREALQLGHNYIGTEHILLGLLGESKGTVAEVLSNLDIELDSSEARRSIIELIKPEERASNEAEEDTPSRPRRLKTGPPPPSQVAGRLRRFVEQKEEEAQRFRRKANKAAQEAQRLRDALELVQRVAEHERPGQEEVG